MAWFYDGIKSVSILLNCDEVKAIFEDAYDDMLKELLNQWTNLAHILMVTFYRSEFSKLLAMRFDSNIRTMKSITLTDERKYIVRNILYTCFENGTIDGKTAFREITKHALANIMY